MLVCGTLEPYYTVLWVLGISYKCYFHSLLLYVKFHHVCQWDVRVLYFL